MTESKFQVGDVVMAREDSRQGPAWRGTVLDTWATPHDHSPFAYLIFRCGWIMWTPERLLLPYDQEMWHTFCLLHKLEGTVPDEDFGQGKHISFLMWSILEDLGKKRSHLAMSMTMTLLKDLHDDDLEKEYPVSTRKSVPVLTQGEVSGDIVFTKDREGSGITCWSVSVKEANHGRNEWKAEEGNGTP